MSKPISHFQFSKYRVAALVLSALFVLISLAVLMTRGLNMGIDFRGGVVLEIHAEGQDISAVRAAVVKAELDGAKVQTVSGENNYLIKFSRNSDLSPDFINDIKNSLSQNLSLEGLQVEFRKVDYVGPTVGLKLIKNAIIAVSLSLIGIMIYVGFRFNFGMSAAAALALLHDMIMVFCFYALFGFEFEVSSIAAILITLGYSINDSVVVFDRIRENAHKYHFKNRFNMVDSSIAQTLRRTIITSLTTLLVTLSIAIFGGHILRGFSLALSFGIVVGTYSTIFIAAPFSCILGTSYFQGQKGEGGMGAAKAS